MTSGCPKASRSRWPATPAASPGKAFVEAFAIGDPLPTMPLFLQADGYVQMPLETTYQSAFKALPQRWRDVLAPSSP